MQYNISNCPDREVQLEYEQSDGSAAPVCVKCNRVFYWSEAEKCWNHAIPYKQYIEKEIISSNNIK